MGVEQSKRACLLITVICCYIPGVKAALDGALVGVIAASAVLLAFAILAVICIGCYCCKLMEKRRREKSTSGIRRLPEEYSTVSGYANYGYPNHWYYTDPYGYGYQLGSYRPKVLMAQDWQPRQESKRYQSLGDLPPGHPIDGINHKVMKKSHKRLSDWLQSNYGENSAAMSMGQEDDDRDQSMTTEQFIQQHLREGGNHDKEFTIVDYVDGGQGNLRKGSATPEMFERKPHPLPPTSMPNQFKTTIGVVQNKTAQHIEISRLTDDEDAPVSTSSPVLDPREDSNLTTGFAYRNDTLTRRQRLAHTASVPDLPPDDTDPYREFMQERMAPFQ